MRMRSKNPPRTIPLGATERSRVCPQARIVLGNRAAEKARIDSPRSMTSGNCARLFSIVARCRARSSIIAIHIGIPAAAFEKRLPPLQHRPQNGRMPYAFSDLRAAKCFKQLPQRLPRTWPLRDMALESSVRFPSAHPRTRADISGGGGEPHFGETSIVSLRPIGWKSKTPTARALDCRRRFLEHVA